MIRIVIIEHEDWMRQGLVGVLSVRSDVEVVASGEDGYDALKLCEKFKPDIVIVNMNLPLLNGIKVAPSLKVRSPHTAVVLITKTVTDEMIVDFVNSGASGILLQNTLYEEISIALRQVIQRNTYYVSGAIASRMVPLFSKHLNSVLEPPIEPREQSAAESVLPLLINRIELQIAGCLGDGLTNREIAYQLKLKEGTIRNYISSILQKMGLKHRTQIAIYAYNNGFTANSGKNKRSPVEALKHSSLRNRAYRKAHDSAQKELLEVIK